MADRGATASIVEREALLRRHLPLVRRLARRHHVTAPAADLDDLISWGAMGLLAAVERYDPARDTLFSTYAGFRIRGAILDQLRALDWVPRRVREKATAVERAAALVEARLGRPATEEELAAALALPLPAYRTLAVEIAPVGMVSLDDSSDGADERAPLCDDGGGPLATLLRRERLSEVAAAIAALPERDQLVLSLYYREELTMKEVGAVLGLTESRVSQLHTRALARLRARLMAPPPELAQSA
jgi:RNA polymerase sigma factor FliA